MGVYVVVSPVMLMPWLGRREFRLTPLKPVACPKIKYAMPLLLFASGEPARVHSTHHQSLLVSLCGRLTDEDVSHSVIIDITHNTHSVARVVRNSGISASDCEYVGQLRQCDGFRVHYGVRAKYEV